MDTSFMNTSLSKKEMTGMDKQTPRELLPEFYKQYDLGDDGGQSLSYVKVEFTKKIFIYFPNFKARRIAVFKHDIHHLATRYPSTIKGETEISAWEIGSGCRQYWAAFLLDLHGIMMGLPFNPAGIFKAFIRGRRSRNLYNNLWSDERVKNSTLGEIREYLLLDKPSTGQKAGFSDILLFLLVLFTGIIYSLLSLVLLPFVLLYTFYVLLRFNR